MIETVHGTWNWLTTPAVSVGQWIAEHPAESYLAVGALFATTALVILAGRLQQHRDERLRLALLIFSLLLVWWLVILLLIAWLSRHRDIWNEDTIGGAR